MEVPDPNPHLATTLTLGSFVQVVLSPIHLTKNIILTILSAWLIFLVTFLVAIHRVRQRPKFIWDNGIRDECFHPVS